MESKKEEILAVENAEVTVENANIIHLSKIYQFEGESIGELNMAGLEDITAADMIRANKVLNSSGNVSLLPELSLEYTLVIAANATKLPLEFYKQLAPKDAIKVKNTVTNFFFGEE